MKTKTSQRNMEQQSSQAPDSTGNIEFDDLLRAAKVKVPLPGTFQQQVWQRIAIAHEASFPVRLMRWLEALLGVFVRPAAATATVGLMISAGLWLGSMDGGTVRDDKSTYVQSVSPFAQLHRGESR